MPRLDLLQMGLDEIHARHDALCEQLAWLYEHGFVLGSDDVLEVQEELDALAREFGFRKSGPELMAA